MMRTKLGLMVAVIAISIAGTALAEPVELFGKVDYRGFHLKYGEGVHVLPKKHRKEASSIKVAAGYMAVVYEEITNWPDKKRHQYTADTRDMHGTFNDKTKVVRVVRRDAQPDASRISYAGSARTYAPSEFKAMLRNDGRTLVDGRNFNPRTTALRSGDCMVAYAEADARNRSADFGALVCVVELADGVTVEMRAVYGGCDFATRGSGGTCEVGLFTETFKVEKDGVVVEMTAKAPNAEVCSEVSMDRMCYSASAELVSVSVEIGDTRGNAVGASVGVGVGGGVDGGYEDGVLSAEFDLKIIAGGSISFSIGVEEDIKAMIALGKSGYARVGHSVVGSTTRMFRTGYRSSLSGAKNVTGKVVGVVESGGSFAAKHLSRGAGALSTFGSSASKGWKSFTSGSWTPW